MRFGCLKRDTPARWERGRELRYAKRICHRPEGKPLGFPCEREVIERAIPIHSDAVSLAYLAGCDQTANRLDQEALDRPLQMARAVFHVGAFTQQEIFGWAAYFNDEGTLGRSPEDAPLNHLQLDVEYSLKLAGAKRPERYDPVNTVDEFRGEFLARSFQPGANDLTIQFLIHRAGCSRVNLAGTP